MQALGPFLPPVLMRKRECAAQTFLSWWCAAGWPVAGSITEETEESSRVPAGQGELCALFLFFSKKKVVTTQDLGQIQSNETDVVINKKISIQTNNNNLLKNRSAQ